MATDVYGIDLGTTYSAIALINDNDMAEIIPNFDGGQTTPSVVYFESAENVIVGEEAKRSSVMEPDDTIELIKRHMGTEYPLEFHGTTYTPEAISALILKSMVTSANEQRGLDINKVVITVPAYFGAQHREATAQAGKIAGLEVLGIVTEPVAAALSIGSHGEGNETIMVYDLGGGTFDTTIMRLADGNVDVLAVKGNRTLGGADWDTALMEIVATKFMELAELDDEDPRNDEDFFADFRLKIEDLKKSLTRRDEANINLTYEGNRQTVTVSRKEFEDATAHLVAETVQISEATVEVAREKDPNLSIDRVLLVGGSSRMPMISTALRERLDWDPQDTDFDLAVAKGAAIYGQALHDGAVLVGDNDPTLSSGADAHLLPAPSEEAIVIRNVLSRAVGVEFVRGEKREPYISFIVHANDEIPSYPEPITASTVADNQTSVLLSIYEQGGDEENEEPEQNNLLKEAVLELPIKTLPKGSPIDLIVEVTSEGLVKLRATEPTSQATIELEASVSILDAEQVKEETEKVSALTLRS